MIALVYGTTAELIKLAPIHQRLDALGHRPLHWCTAQQADELPEAARLLGMPAPDLMIANGSGGHSLRTTKDAVRWLGSVTRSGVVRHRSMRASLTADGLKPCVLVHGDTMTTVVGAVLGRSLRATVGHVEAGLRSHDWRNPFPEELDRRIVGRIAQVHYAPGATEVANLGRRKRNVVLTHGNTVCDAVQLVPADLDPGIADLPERFGLVSLHRLELLQDERFAASMRVLCEAARNLPLVMIYDPVTDQQIEQQGLAVLFDGTSFRRIPKLPYFRFVSLLRRAEYVVTDSGGLQEECAFLGKPCLVHREKTERSDGIGSNARLSGMDVDVLRSFLEQPDLLAVAADRRVQSPADLIVDDLVSRRHA